jgi:hypothetical protein
MQPPDTYALSSEENQRIFGRFIAPRYPNSEAVVSPELHVIGAQPGSGKSFAIDKIRARLKKRDNLLSVSLISGDDFRPFHPLFSTLLRENDALAAYFTDIDSGKWVEQAIALTATEKNHVLLEGTLRNPQVSLDTVTRYLSSGFTAHFHIMAVHEFVSRQRVFLRYIGQIEHKGYGRYTVPEAHDRSYRALPDSVDALVKSGLFATVTVYDADNNVQLFLDCEREDTASAVSSLLSAIRSGADLDSEALLQETMSLLVLVKKQGKDVVAADLQVLKKDIESYIGNAREKNKVVPFGYGDEF